MVLDALTKSVLGRLATPPHHASQERVETIGIPTLALEFKVKSRVGGRNFSALSAELCIWKIELMLTCLLQRPIV